MKVVPYIDATQLAEALDVGKEQLRKLRKEGLPARKHDGKLQFSPQEVCAWFVKTGRYKHATLLQGKYPTDQTPLIVDTESETGNVDAYHERARWVELAMFEFVKNGGKDKLMWATQAWRDASEHRLKVEEKISKIKLDQSRTIPLEVAEKKVIELAQVFKAHMLSLAGKVAPLCEGKGVGEINDIIAGEIDAALREFAGK